MAKYWIIKNTSSRGFTCAFCNDVCAGKSTNQKSSGNRNSFFGEENYGFLMENYGHRGVTSSEGIGSFTIYDWGNGPLSEAYNKMADHYGKKFVNQQEIDGMNYNILLVWADGIVVI